MKEKNNMERRKLFSETPKKERRKLFSAPINNPEPRSIKLFSETSEEDAFQRVFSSTSDELELKLKEYSGKTLGPEEYSEVFGGVDLVEKGFAKVEDSGDYTISPGAFCESRLYSTLTISVTKTLELDPAVMSEPREEVISRLAESGKFSPKTIILLKKAHGLSAEKDSEGYIHDSGITHDLPIEFGGSRMNRPEFEKIIRERYEDAPTDIMEVLKNKGIVKIDGDNVEIIK